MINSDVTGSKRNPPPPRCTDTLECVVKKEKKMEKSGVRQVFAFTRPVLLLGE